MTRCTASSITEILDVMWEHALHSTTSAPQLHIPARPDVRRRPRRGHPDAYRLPMPGLRTPVTRLSDRLEAIGFLERVAPDSRREVALQLAPPAGITCNASANNATPRSTRPSTTCPPHNAAPLPPDLPDLGHSSTPLTATNTTYPAPQSESGIEPD